MRRRAGRGLGNDRELLHMLTMDTGKSQKGHGGHQENIQLPETEGNLRLGFPLRRPNKSVGGEDRSLVEQSSGLSPPQTQEKVEDNGWGGGNSLGERARISPQFYGMAFCFQKSKLLASMQALATHVGPRRQYLAAFKANQFHDETQARNKTIGRKHIYVSETPTQQKRIA